MLTRLLYRLIDEVFVKATTNGSDSLTLGDKEKVAHCEKVILYLLTGNVKLFPYVVWKMFGLAQALIERGFPYFNPEVFDLATGTLNPRTYSLDAPTAHFAYARAIGQNFGFAAGTAALQEARQDLALMRMVGPNGIEMIQGKRGMGTVTFTANQAAVRCSLPPSPLLLCSSR